jgi:uncharacterized protein (DUF58 family)
VRRARFLSLVVWALIALGLVLLDGGLIALALPLVAYLAVAAVTRPDQKQLAVSAHLGQLSAVEGREIVIQVAIQSTGDQPIEEVQAWDTVPGKLEVVDGQTGVLSRLGKQGRLDFTYRIRTSRGLHHFPGVRFHATDPFNLFETDWIEPAERTLLVRPSFRRVRRVELHPSRTGVFAGPYPARQSGPGIEFFGVQPYAEGDPLRWVNWKASARHPGELFINQYEQERVIDVGLIVDARRRSNAAWDPLDSVFPYSVQATASLAELLLSQGNRVGLLIYGSHLDWTVPAYGRVQRERIMLALAKATEGESRIFDHIHHLPTRLFRPKTQLILLSTVMRRDLEYLIRLRARRYPLLVISPDLTRRDLRRMPEGRELDVARRLATIEQKLITRSLTRSGVRRLIWDVELPFEQVMETRFARPQGWLRSIG